MATISKQQKELVKQLTKNVNKALDFIKQEAEDRTPEDTKTLVKNFEVVPAKQVAGKITGKVVNNTRYAFFVEFGTRRAKKYNKPKGAVFFKSGQYKGLPGARMLTRAVDENRKRLNKIITD